MSKRNDSAAGLSSRRWFTQGFGAMGGDIKQNKVRCLGHRNAAIIYAVEFVRALLPGKCGNQP
jgi:hypothetical protein